LVELVLEFVELIGGSVFSLYFEFEELLFAGGDYFIFLEHLFMELVNFLG
jgi:hypothetical protein